jgi:hypothetical protein
MTRCLLDVSRVVSDAITERRRRIDRKSSFAPLRIDPAFEKLPGRNFFVAIPWRDNSRRYRRTVAHFFSNAKHQG